MIPSNKTSIIFHDLDGCLNPKDGEDFLSGDQGYLSEQQSATLNKLGQAIDNSALSHFVINTGRGIVDTHFIAKKIPSEKFRYCILEHSGYAWDMHEDCRLDLCELAKEVGDQTYINKYQGMGKIAELIKWFLGEGGKKFNEEFGIQFTFLEKESNLSILTPQGLHPDKIINSLKKFIKLHFPEQDFVYCYSHAFIDVLCDIHKSDGAKLLCNYLGIDINEALAIGDGMNDLDIFSELPNLLCPNNAQTELKELCLKNGGVVSEHSYSEATFDLLKKIT